MKKSHLIFLLFFGAMLSFAAEENSTEATEPQLEGSPLLTVGGRIDSSFQGGGAVQQGFSIPSIRLSAYGEAGRNIDYRLSFGETREFSTAMLPQIIPVEAFLSLSTKDRRADENESNLTFRFGMFSPELNPWWTPDLSDIELPDYNETHKALFLSHDVGAELSYKPFGEGLEMTMGAFNGVGIFTENTNNAKAFNLYLKSTFGLGRTKLIFGTGNYYGSQSTSGSANYKSNWVSDIFAQWEVTPWNLVLSVDGFFSRFEDSTRTVSPSGGGAIATLGLASWLKAFARYENASDSPILQGAIRSYELGPIFELTEYVRAFVFYQHLVSAGSTEDMGQIRVRLAI